MPIPVAANLFSDPAPLAQRMRPKSLAEFMGQTELTGPGAILATMMQTGKPTSLILWGPAGCGKTTLAGLLASAARLPFHGLSAISAGVAQIRELIQSAERSGPVLVFIDEIHRFSKNQQDALLGGVETGLITLIGATTENPSFELNTALLSRSRVYVLRPLDDTAMSSILQRAINTDPWLISRQASILENQAILHWAGGDARQALGLLENTVLHLNQTPALVTNLAVEQAAMQKTPISDKNGELHYDLISAFIKSMRGSDPNAAIYWLARLLETGQKPSFIARRMLILASEDIGNANPNALLLATSCFQAVEIIGMPEAAIILSQTVVYLASSPKSNASYLAIKAAQSYVEQHSALPVPLHLRNAPTQLMKKQGYGKNYLYAHDFAGNFVDQQYLPEAISGHKFYEPQDNPAENQIRERMKKFWKGKYY